jgi:hypothetical protein
VQLSPETQTTHVGSTIQYDIVVDSYDSNITGYSFDVSVGDADTATIGDVALQGTSASDALTEVTYGSDDGYVSVSATEGSHDNGTIATVTLSGVAEGQTSLSVADITVGDVNFTSYAIRSVSNATISVTGSVPPVVGDTPPQDLDGDGALEDINSDGSFNIVDVSALFNNRNSDAVTTSPEAFDFNDDGIFDIVDISTLFNEVTS